MPQLSEQTGFLLLIVGLALVAVAYLWLVVRAFRTRKAWGFAALLLAPLGGLLYAMFHRRRAYLPIGVAVLGVLVVASPIVINRLVPVRHEEVKNVTTGETDLTITGMTGYDYASLEAKTDLTILQMANKDVTDAHVGHLRGMAKLKVLDLTDTAVTDASLPLLASLPALEDVKLARTNVTDDGVKEFLAKAKALKSIDVRGTTVKSATLRAWKNADKDNRKYLP